MRVRFLAAMALFGAATLAPSTSQAAPQWIDRPITLPRLVFAGDAGLGIGHAHLANRDFTGPGLNLEGAIGITDTVEVGLRTGVRFGDDARAVRADSYARTLFTETYGTLGDSVANPELRVRWSFYSGNVAEFGLDGRLYLPIEQGSRVGVMFGIPAAFHLGSSLRIDTGVYLPLLFYSPTAWALSIPGDFWFQVSNKFWLGPMSALRFSNQGPGTARTDLLLGVGFGYQVAASVDLKWMAFFPTITENQGAQNFGAGFGVQFRTD